MIRLRGNGLLVLPRAPFRLEREAMRTHGDDLEVFPAPGAREWRIETGHYSVAWPAGFVLTDDPDEISPFLLEGARDALLWIAGPLPREKVLPIEKMLAEDQRVRAIADAGEDMRVDIDYVLDDEPWWQRRYLRAVAGRVLLLSGQARAIDEEAVRVAIDHLDATLALVAPS